MGETDNSSNNECGDTLSHASPRSPGPVFEKSESKNKPAVEVTQSGKDSSIRLTETGGGDASSSNKPKVEHVVSSDSDFHDDQCLGDGHSIKDEGFIIKRQTSNDDPKPNLIVNYLPQSFTDNAFYHLFAPYGKMESIKIMRDSQTGYSFGYGFVNFCDVHDAVDARNALNGLQLEHKRIKVSFARPPSDDIKDTNLFVTGLAASITELELDKLFSPFGVIVHLRVLRDRQTKATRGVAFVRCETRTEACAAILDLNGIVPPGASDPIRVRLAQDHGKQKAAYLAGYQAALHMKKSNVMSYGHGHSETSFGPPIRQRLHNRGRPMTACVGELPVRAITSRSEPALYWKGFLRGSREPQLRRPETSGGRDRRGTMRF